MSVGKEKKEKRRSDEMDECFFEIFLLALENSFNKIFVDDHALFIFEFVDQLFDFVVGQFLT